MDGAMALGARMGQTGQAQPNPTARNCGRPLRCGDRSASPAGELMGKYAENTTVSADRSRAEIEKTLSKYGADQFLYGWNGPEAMIGFRMNERFVRFTIPMPDKNDKEFTHSHSGRRRRTLRRGWCPGICVAQTGRRFAARAQSAFAVRTGQGGRSRLKGGRHLKPDTMLLRLVDRYACPVVLQDGC